MPRRSAPPPSRGRAETRKLAFLRRMKSQDQQRYTSGGVLKKRLRQNVVTVVKVNVRDAEDI